MITTGPITLNTALMSLLQDVKVGDITSILTMTDVTVGGVLVAVSLYLGWKNSKKDKKITELELSKQKIWREYIDDVKSHAADFKDEADKFHKSFEQIKEIVLYNERLTKS